MIVALLAATALALVSVLVFDETFSSNLVHALDEARDDCRGPGSSGAPPCTGSGADDHPTRASPRSSAWRITTFILALLVYVWPCAWMAYLSAST